PVLAPRERPILFSAPMVLAILDGRKTVTRRLGSRYQVGDLLWVKETWMPINNIDEVIVLYRADNGKGVARWSEIPHDWRFPKAAARGNVSPLFMPKWAARIWLEVTAVRKERLQDI